MIKPGIYSIKLKLGSVYIVNNEGMFPNISEGLLQINIINKLLITCRPIAVSNPPSSTTITPNINPNKKQLITFTMPKVGLIPLG